MKKAVIIGMAAAISLTGCRNELIEKSPDNAIVIRAFPGNHPLYANGEEIMEFPVFGTLRDRQGKEQPLFDGRPVTRNGTSWSYTPVEFWQEGCSYRFAALFPPRGNWRLERQGCGSGSEVSLHFNNARAGGQEDLLLAREDREAVTVPANEPELSFNFTRQLCHISFSFENGYPSQAAYGLEISGLQLDQVVSDARMDLSSKPAPWIPGTERTSFTLELEEGNLLLPGSGQTVRTRPVFIIPVRNPMTLEFNVTLYLDEEKMTTYHRRAVLPPLDLKKGTGYNLKAIIDESNTHPSDKAPDFIINGAERWEEDREIEGGQI